MEKSQICPWQSFIKKWLIYSTFCFATGFFLGVYFHVRSHFLIETALGLLGVVIIIPAKTRLINKPRQARYPWEKNEIWKIAAILVILGTLTGISTFTAIFNWDWVNLPLRVNNSLFILVVVGYHIGENTYALIHHAEEYSSKSFVFYHQGLESYAYMILGCQIEFLLEAYFFYELKASLNLPVVLTFFPLSILGLILRNITLHQAKSNFSHYLRHEKDPEHKLVTSGMYSLDRHPSYVAFSMMAICCSILMKNLLMVAIGMPFMLRTYRLRIAEEEAALIKIFGEEYKTYMRKVGSIIG